MADIVDDDEGSVDDDEGSVDDDEGSVDDDEGSVHTNRHIRVTINDDEHEHVIVVLRDAFMLSPVHRENLPPANVNPNQPTEIELHETNADGTYLVLWALDEMADTDPRYEYGSKGQDLLECATNFDGICSALALADKYAVTTLFVSWCHKWCLRPELHDSLRIARALYLLDPTMARSVMTSALGYTSRHPAIWSTWRIGDFGIRHWQTLIRIIHRYPNCLGEPDERQPAGYIHWPTVAKYFPWADKRYWVLGPAGHNVPYDHLETRTGRDKYQDWP